MYGQWNKLKLSWNRLSITCTKRWQSNILNLLKVVTGGIEFAGLNRQQTVTRLIDYLFTQTWYKTTQIIATEDEEDSQAPGALIAALVAYWFIDISAAVSHSKDNKKAQLTLSNPRDVKACQNCSNSTCFVSFHRIPFPRNCQCIASRGRPIFSQALGLYSCTQFEIRCLPIIKFLVQIAST